jgi:DNA-3-methyladenine glycosylase
VKQPPVGVVLPRSFFECDSVELAPLLLNKLLSVDDGRVARIVEVEAYRADDPASHTYRGLTPRNRVMFGPPGHLYVYFSYGVHWCANVVCGTEGEGAAVLLRALDPVAGVDSMYAARPRARRPEDLCSGPGKLTQALGLEKGHNGADLVAGDHGVWLSDDGIPPPSQPVCCTRIGISVAEDQPWRWLVPGNRHVSRRPKPLPAVDAAVPPSGDTAGATRPTGPTRPTRPTGATGSLPAR